VPVKDTALALGRIEFESIVSLVALLRRESLNQLRGLLDDELLPRKEFYALFNLGRTIVKMLGEQIGD
jgi:hypothetical protein